MVTPKILKSFWSKVLIGSENECWEFQGSTSRGNGYGNFWDGEKLVGAHRFSLELALNRSIRPKMVAMHLCDNPPCCNPKHLKEGTTSQNITGAAKHILRVKTVEHYDEVLQMNNEGKTQWQIVAKTGLSRPTVSRIINGHGLKPRP